MPSVLYVVYCIQNIFFLLTYPQMQCRSHDAPLLAVYLYVNSLDSHWPTAIMCSLPVIKRLSRLPKQ